MTISTNPNKTTKQKQQFLQFITRRIFTAQHVSGVLTPIITISTTAVAGLWFYLRSVVVAVLLVVVGYCYQCTPKVKPEFATAVVELLVMGMRTPETC
jgi:uncharacterized membrane protein